MRTADMLPQSSLLAFEEVVEVGAPAVFSAFGDHLVYVGGEVYALPREVEPAELQEPERIAGARRITSIVGVEYGWRHLWDCRCPLCSARGELLSA